MPGKQEPAVAAYLVTQVTGDVEQNVCNDVCKEFVTRNLIETQGGLYSRGKGTEKKVKEWQINMVCPGF